MPFLGNKKIIKFIYFLGIIRWYNVLLMVLAQYFLALFVFGPQYSFHQIILDKTLHLMVLSTNTFSEIIQSVNTSLQTGNVTALTSGFKKPNLKLKYDSKL